MARARALLGQPPAEAARWAVPCAPPPSGPARPDKIRARGRRSLERLPAGADEDRVRARQAARNAGSERARRGPARICGPRPRAGASGGRDPGRPTEGVGCLQFIRNRVPSVNLWAASINLQSIFN